MKKLWVFVMALALVLGANIQAKAATSAINNLPGGAGVMQWMVSPDGTRTLLNIQNIGQCGPIAVHVTFYDYNSNHLFDIVWPMSDRDNLGIAMSTQDGRNVNLQFEPGETPTSLVEQGLVHNHVFALPGVGPNNLEYGYATVTVTALDTRNARTCYTRVPFATLAPGNGNGNPLDDPMNINAHVALPDLLVARAAVLDSSGVLGLNGQMLQGFVNIPQVFENAAPAATMFENIFGPDAACNTGTVDWDGNGRIGNTPVFARDKNGIDIQAPELYITENHTTGRIALLMGAAGGGACAANGRLVALGAASNKPQAGVYWARYNVAPGVSDSTLIMVFPANNPTAENPAGLVADPRSFDVLPFNDNEQAVSVPNLVGPEVTMAPFDSSTNAPLPGQPVISHTTYTSGEAMIQTGAPVFGYVYTTVQGVGSDIYPLVPQRIWVNVSNLVGVDLRANPDVVMVP